MYRYRLIVAAAAFVAIAASVQAVGPRGGTRGGGGRPSGGHSVAHASPSFSHASFFRPAASARRSTFVPAARASGGYRPSGGYAARPVNNFAAGRYHAAAGGIIGNRAGGYGNRAGGFANRWSGYGRYGRGGFRSSYLPGYYGNRSWYHGDWNGWNSYPSFWYGAGAGWLGATAYDYSNPFYVAGNDYGYAQPIPVPVESDIPQTTYNSFDDSLPNPFEGPPQNASIPAPVPPDPAGQAAATLFDTAQAAFKAADYPKALDAIDRAIKLKPQDRVLHEFRSLTLFALGKYRDSAAGLYALLASGPGWDWATVSSFYGDPNDYTRQLRALEADARTKPTSAEDRFVLAYQYLVLGEQGAAIKMLQQYQTLMPKDQLAASLLAALKPKADGNKPLPGE